MLFGMRRIHKARRQSRLTITFTKNAGLIPKHHGHVLNIPDSLQWGKRLEWHHVQNYPKKLNTLSRAQAGLWLVDGEPQLCQESGCYPEVAYD